MSKELIERLLSFEGSDDLGNGDFSACIQAAETLKSQAAEIERLKKLNGELLGASEWLVSTTVIPDAVTEEAAKEQAIGLRKVSAIITHAKEQP